MSVDIRLQLVNRRSLWKVVEALAAGAAPPASAFDLGPDAAAQWGLARAAWTSGDDAAAAGAACWLCVMWSAATLPAVALRNVALTHRPIRMPDVYAALDLPGLGAPRSVFEGVAGVRPGIVEALPRRLDADARTGAFIGDPERVGATLAGFLASHPEAEAERRTLARMLALLRAAERADLQVWEAVDDAAIVAAPPGHASSLVWPGLSRCALEAPLSAEEWAAVEGPWLGTTRGDLADLIALVERVAPGDVQRVPLACRALIQAFTARADRHTPYSDDLLPPVLTWLESIMQVASLAGFALLAHATLERCFLNEAPQRSIPAEAWMAAAEVATSADFEAFERSASKGGPEARRAFDQLVQRLASMRPSSSPEALQTELRALYEAYRGAAIPDPIARTIAERWYALYRLDPARAHNRRISAYVLQDAGPCGHLLELLLGPGPELSVGLAHMVECLFAVTPDCPRDDSLFPTTVRAYMPRLYELAATLGRQDEAYSLRWWLDHFEPEPEESEEYGDYGAQDDSQECANDPSPAALAEALVASWHHLFDDQHLRAQQMVEAGHGAELAAAFIRWLSTHPAPDLLASLGMRLTGALNVRGLTDPAAFDLCIDVARRAFAEQPDADFLYNAACAHVRRGELERAAAVLAEAIAVDPTQAADARGDTDFQPYLDHPAFARLLGPGAT